MIKVRRVDARPDHQLAVQFSDGTDGIVDFRPFLQTRALSPLRDQSVFAEARVVRGTVTWPGDLDIASEALYARAHNLPMPESFEQARQNELLMSLHELRRMANVTQEQLAGLMQIDQAQLSRFERQPDRLLSSLRNYVSALGGELEVVAVIGDKRITLRGV